MPTPTNKCVSESDRLEDSWFNWKFEAPRTTEKVKKNEPLKKTSHHPAESLDDELNDNWFEDTQE